jgi:hypothetical protein
MFFHVAVVTLMILVFYIGNVQDDIYIYKSLGPRKKNPQQKKERAAKTFFRKIEHQTS